MSEIRTLLFGGGGVHDYEAICPNLQSYLEEAGGFAVDYVVEDYDAFLEERLAPYDLVVLYHTGKTLTPEQASGLTGWVASGKGYVGFHGAADSFKNAPDYLAMIGGYFTHHPFCREYLVSLHDPSPGITSELTHPVFDGLEGYTVEHWEQWPVYEYLVKDEQYILEYDSRNTVIATALFKGIARPVAWVKDWGKGRVFYCALGHDEEASRHPLFKQFAISASRWAGTPPEEE